MISLMGNISVDDLNMPFQHSHGVFSYLKDNGEIAVVAGHLKDARVSYTGEIVLQMAEKRVGRMFDTGVGIDVWKLS